MRWFVLGFLLLAALAVADKGRVQRDVRTKRFSTAIVCRACHSNAPDSGAMRDGLGRGIAPHDLWQSSMMANAARDPFFRAELAVAGKEQEARCLRCHAPMAAVEAGDAGLSLAQLDREDEEHEWDTAALARDGVSCTLCHQIQPGAKPDGRFVVGDDREIYGPFDKQFGLAMHRVSKFWPVQGKHVLESAHCGTCHSSSLPGETTYDEWRNSSREKTCQDCHMPSGGRTRIARTSHGGDIANLPSRAPVGQHLFVGGNTLVPRILRDNIDELHVKAPAAAFDATVEATRALLQTRTARVAVQEATREGDKLHIVVLVENLAGHKFPTGHTSRHAWLRLRVKDSKGKVVFASGESDRHGVQPHRATLTRPEHVQVYEAVRDKDRLVKDNRLLPKGWSAKHPDAAATKPVGVNGDADFVAGSDTVVYDVAFPEEELPYTVEVALLYQPIAPHYLDGLFRNKHEEVARFQRLYEKAGNPPELVARAKLVVAE